MRLDERAQLPLQHAQLRLAALRRRIIALLAPTMKARRRPWRCRRRVLAIAARSAAAVTPAATALAVVTAAATARR